MAALGSLTGAGNWFVVFFLTALLGGVAALTIYRGLNPGWIALLFVSDALVFLATIRVAWEILAPRAGAPEARAESRLIPFICAAIMLILGIGIIAFGIFPQPLVYAIQAAFGK